MKLSAKVILASGSPRRKQLLQDAGISFEVKTTDFEETFPPDMPAENVAEYLAIGKNQASRKNFESELIITADTVVIFNDQILGKPKDHSEAIQTIGLLSGKVHEVVTGVCISDPFKQIAFSSSTRVKFSNLASAEIERYVKEFQPLDKAGSYAIQEWIGLIGIEWIHGSFYNVVGLPVHEVYRILKAEFS